MVVNSVTDGQIEQNSTDLTGWQTVKVEGRKETKRKKKKRNNNNNSTSVGCDQYFLLGFLSLAISIRSSENSVDVNNY